MNLEELTYEERGIQHPTDLNEPRKNLTSSHKPITAKIYDIKLLQRIRPHADGLRNVNRSQAVCTFIDSSSSSSSSSDDSDNESDISSQLADLQKDEPEYSVGDKVLFYARGRSFNGIIIKRLKNLHYYDIKASNGTLFSAIECKNIQLVKAREKTIHYRVGDYVLWVPNKQRKQSYRARLIKKHRNYCFDIRLMTGSIKKCVSYKSLIVSHSAHGLEN